MEPRIPAGPSTALRAGGGVELMCVLSLEAATVSYDPRASTQFRYHDKVHTFVNTFRVYDVGEAVAQ